MATILYRSNNWGEPLGALPYLTFAHDEDVDGTDMLTVVTRGWASKRDRLLWQDVNDEWHEHIVDAAVTERQDGVLVTTITCSNSISELFGQSLSSTTWDGTYYGNPDGLLDIVLDGTQWEMGDNGTFDGVDIEIWAKSKRQCITEICELVHGELVTEIQVSGTRVVGRKVSIVHHRGDSTAKHYFAWGKNASSIRREVAADEVYTEVYGVGAPIQVDSSRYPTRYASTVSDAALIDSYGMIHRTPLPGSFGDGEMGEDGNLSEYEEVRGHFTMMYVDDSLDSTAKLQAACTRQLQQNNQPLINYTFEFADIDGDGMAGLSLGDAALVRDDEMGLVTTKRVTHVSRTYYGRPDTGRECSASMRVVVGERKNNMFEQLEAQEKVGQWVTGNHVDVNARESMSTKGKYDRSSSGGGGGGDGVAHTLDGVAITGTVAFTSASGS